MPFSLNRNPLKMTKTKATWFEVINVMGPQLQEEGVESLCAKEQMKKN